MLRSSFRLTQCLSPSLRMCIKRGLASQYQNLLIDRDPELKELAVMKLNNPPVNILSPGLMSDFSAAIKDLENDKQTRAVIVTSTSPKMFCAGLDIKKMYQVSEDDVRKLWTVFQDSAVAFLSTKLITIAALNGHAIAGGCAFAVQCDHRIMINGPYTIGIKAAALGLTVPVWIMESMSRLLGIKEAERALTQAKMFSPVDALRIGLIDKIVAEDELMDAAKTEAKKWLEIPDEARALSKLMMRGSMIKTFEETKEQDIEDAVRNITSDEVQNHIKRYLDSFKEQTK